MNPSNNYVNALIELSYELKIENEFDQEINLFLDLIKQDEEIFLFLKNNLYTLNNKLELIDSLSKEGFNEYFLNFLKVLSKNQHQKYLIEILKQYIFIKSKKLGILFGKVFTTKLLSKEEHLNIESSISTKLNKKVSLENEIEKNLIAGIKVIVEDKIFNYSIEEKLNLLKQELLK